LALYAIARDRADAFARHPKKRIDRLYVTCPRMSRRAAVPFGAYLLRVPVMGELFDVVDQPEELPLPIDLVFPRSVKRPSPLLYRTFANTGSTVAKRCP